MLAQQGAQMLPFVLPVENSSAKKGRACAQCIGEAAGGARRVCGASNVKKNHDTLVECRKQKCVCAVQCVMRVSCGEQFTRHMLGVDAGRAVGSQSRAAQRVCQSRWCALSRRGRRWRACDFVGGRSFWVRDFKLGAPRAVHQYVCAKNVKITRGGPCEGTSMGTSRRIQRESRPSCACAARLLGLRAT